MRLLRKDVANFGEIARLSDRIDLLSAHPDNMNVTERATQALLASLRAQSTADGHRSLHALIDPDLHPSKEPGLTASARLVSGTFDDRQVRRKD